MFQTKVEKILQFTICTIYFFKKSNCIFYINLFCA